MARRKDATKGTPETPETPAKQIDNEEPEKTQPNSQTHASSNHWIIYIFATAYFVAIGGYWFVRPLKSGIFTSTVGIVHEPTAKLGTMAVLVAITFVYEQFVSRTSIKLVGPIVCGVICLLFLSLGIAIELPGVGLSNTVLSSDRYIGWLSYWIIECYISILLPMIGAMVPDLIVPDDQPNAQKIFSIVNQVGALVGSSCATRSGWIGFGNMFFIQSTTVFFIGVCLYFLYDRYAQPTSTPSKSSNDNKRNSSGLLMVATRPYLSAILVVAACNEILFTVFDYQMKVKAKEAYPDPEAYAEFDAWFGVASNAAALAFAIVGTRQAVHYLGLSKCLLIFPIYSYLAIGIIGSFGSIWAIFWVVVGIKALGYSLHKPTQELLWGRTAKQIRFSCKPWIEGAGNRTSKGLASLVNTMLNWDMSQIIFRGCVVGTVVSTCWLSAAFYLGNTYLSLSRKNILVT